jgi:hypothetical protein
MLCIYIESRTYFPAREDGHVAYKYQALDLDLADSSCSSGLVYGLPVSFFS